MNISLILRPGRWATRTMATLLVSIVLGAALAIAGTAAQALAAGAPTTTIVGDPRADVPVSSSYADTTMMRSDAQASTHQPHSTATPRPDGRGVPSGGGEAAPVLGVASVALILGGALVLLLMTARRTRHLRKGEDGDR